jgi:uncharacterized membrane protein YccC
MDGQQTSRFGALVQLCRAAVSSLGRELAAWKPSRERAILGTEAMLSVTLSVALAHAFHLSNTWWAAISGFAVMQASFSSCVQRAVHRMIGTVIGAAFATLVGLALGDRPWLFVPALGLIGAVAVYYGNGSRAPYAWVLGGVTGLMVTFEAHVLLSFRATASFAALRLAEVAVGTFACVLVASVFHFGPKWVRRTRPPIPSATAAPVDESVIPTDPIRPAPPEASHSIRMLLCLQAALAVVILAIFAYFFNMPGFAQSMVTTIAVLIVPAKLLADRTRQPVAEKMVQRTVGCLLAGLLGVALLPLMQGQVIPCLLVLSAGVWIGCHVQSGKEGASYIGVQFTIAFIMVFVQDHHWSADPGPALLRLSGILMGIVVLAVVMLTTARLHVPRNGLLQR